MNKTEAYYKMNKDERMQALQRYESYLDFLREDLRRLERQLMQVNAELSDLIQQRHTLKVVTNKDFHPSGFKAQVNLGCNFFMEADVTNTSTMLINIGLNHYLECSPSEANLHLDFRQKSLEKVSKEVQVNVAKVKSNIQLTVFTIGQIYEVARNS